MKKLLLILFPLFLNAQIVSVGFDISNAIQGSDVNTQALDLQLKVISVTDNEEIGIQFEYFDVINYFSWGLHYNRNFNITHNLKVLAGVEGIQIIRKDFGVLAYGFNGEIRYFLNDKIGLSYQYNIRRRTDLQIAYNDGRFVKSGFINLIYKWQ